ncbi:hypothetical protein OZ410_04790 [Robiginitalea sp. M366]|uniref:hypothetical protein n=1 Tax=Robiginitalea aestuariiviva TaxID=3036903 RepID=UPI00240E6842|nr:hypothetical protein [Robiginitalea aestuariiviva]MDG1571619.1 hypothetical protein [Robiginitalea aestuariiviva]
MDLKPFIASLALIWALCIVAPPSLWYTLQEDGICLSLTSGEEEPGETQGPDKWEEKITCSHAFPGLLTHGLQNNPTPFTLPLPAGNLARDIVLPPPEAPRA